MRFPDLSATENWGVFVDDITRVAGGVGREGF